MAKSIIVLASALCFLSFLGSAYSLDRFYVEGTVYCDTCRAQFLTRLSKFMPGATVRVECKAVDNPKNITFTQEAVTDSSGSYSVEVDGDHEDEVCEVVLVKSSVDDCAEVDHESHLEQAARVSITGNNGIVSPYRTANPLGFLQKDRLPECADVFQELGMQPDGTFINN